MPPLMKSPLTLCAALTVSAALAMPATAQEPPALPSEPPVERTTSADPASEHTDAFATLNARASELGCDLIFRALAGEQQVGACADQRVLVSWGEDVQVRRAPGPVEALVGSDGELWVITRHQSATPLKALPSDAPRLPAGATSPPPSPETPPSAATEIRGQVLEASRGVIIIDLGSDQGLTSRQLIELYTVEEVPLGTGGETSSRTRTLAVAPVRALSADRAELALGLAERVPPGARARTTEREATASRFAPERLGGLSRLSFTLRPFLALGTVGAGTLSQASASYQLPGPWTAELLIDPLAIGFSRAGNLLAAIGTAIVSYDTTPFQVGLGVGTTTINSSTYQSGDSDTGAFGAELGFAISQKVRLGALDGLHLEVVNNFFLTSSAFRYGGTAGSAQVPAGSIGKSSWIVARGGAGFAGHAFGEVGLKVLAYGNGDRGSLFFTPTVGLAQLRGTRVVDCPSGPDVPSGLETRPDDLVCYAELSQGGPMIGFQVEWRP
ncbi:hypothetical protein DL240_03150 [Lujinxingia litoralis]|uniref:Uncharacterized protein n=1 Tax=Lujinxingia litoralis TaxID=2211119 RepID=A0A328CAQ0_9DELT|nr:hypothetical protein [Lujinxingia litoralis]RAL25222.1 hypothetical protein DL240_03150 [Lujinxingia litoralis]